MLAMRRICGVRFRVLAILSIAVAWTSACTTHVVSTSPDGRHTATVTRMPDFLDNGFDSLALADAEGTESQLMDATFEFGEWCNTVIWAPDSRSVGFLISDDRLAVYDVRTRMMRAYFYLAGSGCCGGPQESRNVAFSADGTQVSFDRFDRPLVRMLPRLRRTLFRQEEHEHARR